MGNRGQGSASCGAGAQGQWGQCLARAFPEGWALGSCPGCLGGGLAPRG